jgi:predicted negative regulator of RcsB-dependent stress response
MAKKEEQHNNELLENPAALAETLEGAEDWVERNSKLVIGVSVVILLAVAGYFGFSYFKDQKNQEAQKEMFYAVYSFEHDSLDLALNGDKDGNHLGLLQIIDDYGMTDAAKLANFYAGAAYLKKGSYEAARLHLEDFSSNDLLIQARAYCLIGDSYMEEQKWDDAASYYIKAADYKANKFFSPTYLMKAGLAYEKASKNDKAIETYNKVIESYSESAEYNNARKFKAKLENNS